MLLYKILKPHNLIIEYFEGKINLDNFKAYYYDLFQESDYSHEHVVLGDIRKADFQFEMDGISKFIDFLSESEKKFKLQYAKRVAILTDTPKQVALSMILCQLSIGLTSNFEIFSTVEAAIKWLVPKDFNPNEYDNLISNLKSETIRLDQYQLVGSNN